MTVEEWLGKENQLGTDIWTKKYCNEGEDFEAWVQRVSHSFAVTYVRL